VKIIDELRQASLKVYENVKDLAGTPDAAGDFGRGAGGDISRNIDIVAEKTVLDYLKEKNFDCTVLGEECGKVELAENPKGFVIMDAIDGSANAVRGIPFFCCSLAFATDYKLSTVTDAVVTNLTTGEQYWASKKQGAFLNEKKINVHNTDPIYRIIGLNTSGATPNSIDELETLFEKNNHIRHFGANALEMVMFAAGMMDAFIDFRKKIRIQDIAAGYLIVKEAGGLILDENLQSLDSDLGYETRLSFIAASNQKILDEIMHKIRK
jgi:myo-inositol-1(or 4)-monophosphatase